MINFSASDVVVLTGATGFTGRFVTRQLLETGCQLRIVARASSNTLEFENHERVQIIRGEIFDIETVRRACTGCHYVLHLAASFRDSKSTEIDHHNIHVNSTQLLAQEALRQPDFRRFVLVSTVGVHGQIEESPANEGYRFNPGDSYQRTKAKAETWISDFGRTHNLPLTIVRPVAVMGPGDTRLLKIFKLGKLPVIPMLGYAGGFYHLIHVEDLARCILAAANPELPQGAVYILGNREPSSVKDIVAEVAGTIGRKPRFLHIPAWPFLLFAYAVETICSPLGIEPPIRRRRVRLFTNKRAFDTSRMHDTFGPLIRFDNQSGIRHTVEWYKNQKLL